jgi:O-antigen ligase
MPSGLATVVYALGIVGLFLLERNRTSRPSPALWIPITWLALGASRSVSEWVGGVTYLTSPDQYLEGSPLDRAIFTALVAAGVMVLMARGKSTGSVLRASAPLVVFFAYCAISVLWSEYPLVAFKRWIKATGNLVMVLVVLTDAEPRVAIKALLARTGFVLIPLSALLIKYYPELGRGFDGWTGRAYNMGAGMDKNALGVICLIFGLSSLWRCVIALQSREPRERRRHTLIAHGVVLALALWLLSMADSATSLGCFLAGSVFIALTSWRALARRRALVHIVAAAIVVVCLVGLFLDTELGLVQMMGRDPTLTTRTQLWEEVLRIPVNPLVGTGFESFWLGERAKLLWRTHWWHPNQAHNGYLEVYLNSGWLGVALLGIVLAWGYRNVVSALHRDPEVGRLKLAFFMAALLYNLTEAAFKVMHPVWVIFLLAVTVIPGRARSVQREAVPARDAAPVTFARRTASGWERNYAPAAGGGAAAPLRAKGKT